jgi:4-amino-4-deoxy-L-arabinose transferase-like glycosyltransferase
VIATDTTPSSARRAWIAVAVAWSAAVAALLLWLLATSTGLLREQLKTAQFWSLEACVLVGVLLVVWMARNVKRDISRADAFRLGGLVAVALLLTLFVAPRTNRIFYDEQIYQSIGQNMADQRLAQVCNDGNVEYGRLHCASGEYNKQPYAYPHALSLVYRVFGVRDGVAFAVNAVVMAATVCAVYLLVVLLFRDRDAAFFAGLLMALTPQQLLWSATSAVEPSASLAAVVAVLCAAYYVRGGGIAALAALAVSSAYAVQFRPESLLILPVVALVAWPRLRIELTQPRAWWAGLVFFVFVAVHVAHLFAVRHVGWGTEAARFSLAYVPGNLQVNGWFYLFDQRFPFVFTLLAFVGCFGAAFGRDRVAMVLYFFVYFAIGLVFYAGSFNYGADVRYSLLTYPPIAVLGGLGAARVTRLVAGGRSALPARAWAIAILSFQFLWYAPVVRATTEEAWAARADVAFAKSVVAELPRNSYVLTHNPGMFHIWSMNAGQMSRVSGNPRFVDFLLSRYPGGVYVHWNFWCNVNDPVQPEFCRQALDAGTVELVREHRERDQRFAFYRLRTQQ